MLFGHGEPEQIGVMLLGRFLRLYAFEPEHYAVTCIMVRPANQSPKTLHHRAVPSRFFARLMPTVRDGLLPDLQRIVVYWWLHPIRAQTCTR